jgi:hypothetical protein
VTPTSEQPKKGGSRKAPGPPENGSRSEDCKQWTAAGYESFEHWIVRRNPPLAVQQHAWDWLRNINDLGPDFVPSYRKTIQGTEQELAVFWDMDLVISYTVDRDTCSIGIVDVSSISEHTDRHGPIVR